MLSVAVWPDIFVCASARRVLVPNFVTSFALRLVTVKAHSSHTTDLVIRNGILRRSDPVYLYAGR